MKRDADGDVGAKGEGEVGGGARREEKGGGGRAKLLSARCRVFDRFVISRAPPLPLFSAPASSPFSHAIEHEYDAAGSALIRQFNVLGCTEAARDAVSAKFPTRLA